MIKLRTLVGYFCLLFLVYLFGIHGIKGMLGSPNFISLATGMGIPLNLAQIMITLVGYVDIFVALSLLYFRKWWLLMYAGVWPSVPAIIEFITTGHPHIIEPLLAPWAALVVFLTLYMETQIEQKSPYTVETRKQYSFQDM